MMLVAGYEEVRMNSVRWGMIGCGAVAEMKSGPAFQKAAGSHLVAVMRRDGKLAADYARRHHVPRWYDSADQLIDDPEVDAVYVATHPNTHKEYTLRAARAGKPVYCENPLGISPMESEEMVLYCQEHNIPFFSAYYRRALPKYLQIKRMLDGEAIGDIRFANVIMYQTLKDEDRGADRGSWRVRPEVSGGGRFLDVGSHALDLIDWFCGSIVSAHGQASNQGKAYVADDMVSGSWVTSAGIHGTGAWCFSTYRDYDRIDIYGTEGMISFSVLDVAGPITLKNTEGVRTIASPDPPQHVAQPLIQTVVDELLGRGACPSTGGSGMRTDWVMAQIQGK